MAFSVRELLNKEALNGITVIGGTSGLDNEIKGATIIETPDIAKFISGGEVLLTGLYAFKTSTVEEFGQYLNGLTHRNISALMLKQGRNIEFAESKVQMMTDYANEHNVPLLDVPFEVSFGDILIHIMERLFNEEVTRLKLFKTAYDSFTSLLFSQDSNKNMIQSILETLKDIVNNPAALYDQHMRCLASTDDAPESLVISDSAADYEPDYYSRYRFLRQDGVYPEYIAKIKMNFRECRYLVVIEKNQPFKYVDCIAMENAIISLKLDYSMQSALIDLEKKFENDIMNNILNGKIHSMEELKKNAGRLDIPPEASYRVIVFGTNTEAAEENFTAKVRDTGVLGTAVSEYLSNAKIANNQDKIVAVQLVDKNQTLEEYRLMLGKTVKRMQKMIVKEYGKDFVIKAGVGRVADGIMNLPKSFREANKAFSLADIAGEISEGCDSQTVIFSDLGIFRLLCQIDDPDALMEFVPEGLKKLYSYKNPPRDDLIITLKTYLDRNQNLSKTARDLYVHYKTAAYRIEKISGITGIDFNNSRELLAVRIGLVVYKMIENITRDAI